MEQTKITYYELLTYLALFGIVVGILLGLIPLILGIKRNKRSYGLYGMIASIIAGIFSPLLSIVVVAVFVWLILRKPEAEIVSEAKPEETSESDIS